MERPKASRYTRRPWQHGRGLREAVHLILSPPEPLPSTQPQLREYVFSLTWLCLLQTSVLESSTECMFSPSCLRDNWKVAHFLPLSPGEGSSLASQSSFILWAEVKHRWNMVARISQTSSLINLPQMSNCVFPPLESQHTLSREIWLAWLMIHSQTPSTMVPLPEATTITLYL